MTLQLFFLGQAIFAGAGLIIGAVIAGDNGYQRGYRHGVADEAQRHAQGRSGLTVLRGGAA